MGSSQYSVVESVFSGAHQSDDGSLCQDDRPARIETTELTEELRSV